MAIGHVTRRALNPIVPWKGRRNTATKRTKGKERSRPRSLIGQLDRFARSQCLPRLLSSLVALFLPRAAPVETASVRENTILPWKRAISHTQALHLDARLRRNACDLASCDSERKSIRGGGGGGGLDRMSLFNSAIRVGHPTRSVEFDGYHPLIGPSNGNGSRNSVIASFRLCWAKLANNF